MLEEDEAAADAAVELADGTPVELPADDDLDIKDSPKDSGGEDEGAEAVDSRSIPGLDKGDALAEALLSPRGLAVTADQATGIRSLFDALDAIDRKPLSFTAQTSNRQQRRGRFARSKQQRRSGFVTTEIMKR